MRLEPQKNSEKPIFFRLFSLGVMVVFVRNFWWKPQERITLLHMVKEILDEHTKTL